ncbi:MAG: family 16 glycoside hydrolase, partial [Planctomycetota bacterium]
RPYGWNRLRVVARGDTIMTWLNGVAAAHLVDSMTPKGFIGLQVHGVGDRTDPLEVRWRDIRIRELDRTPAKP